VFVDPACNLSFFFLSFVFKDFSLPMYVFQFLIEYFLLLWKTPYIRSLIPKIALDPIFRCRLFNVMSHRCRVQYFTLGGVRVYVMYTLREETYPGVRG
jgi:hypothetical protein